MTIGVLSLQGDFQAHFRALALCGVRAIAVRDAQSLQGCDGLVIPGGESTTMSRLCDRFGLWEPLRARLAEGMGAFGTCAGMILLARDIEGATTNFAQQSLGALDIIVARNAYGAQRDSFETQISVDGLGDVLGVFIRAPRIIQCGPSVEVLARYQNAPVVVRRANVMALAFHPEIAGETRLHQLWLDGLQTEASSEPPR